MCVSRVCFLAFCTVFLSRSLARLILVVREKLKSRGMVHCMAATGLPKKVTK